MEHQISELTKELLVVFNDLCKKHDHEEVALELARFATCLILALVKATGDESIAENFANNIANALEGK